MKITEVKVKKVEIPLKEPFTISIGTTTALRSAYVEIETDEGISGYGEGAPFIIVNGDNLEGTIESIKLLGNAIIGTDPMDIEKIYSIMDEAISHNPTAKAAIDMAIYDLIGKITNQPLYKVLGGYGDYFKTDMTLGINEPAKMAEQAKDTVNKGFKTLKIKVGTDPKVDVERIKRIREAAGKDVYIRIDANQAWNPKEAISIIEEMSKYDIELIEQPVPAYDLKGLKEVTKNSPIPIMADESVFDSRDALELVSMEAVDLINIKLMKCGGIREALKINAIAEAAGIECMIGCMMETNVSITAAAHLATAVKNITKADLDSTLFLPSLPVEGGVKIEKGRIDIPNLPGLGLGKF